MPLNVFARITIAIISSCLLRFSYSKTRYIFYRLHHFDFVRSADLYRIGLSAPAIARIKDALKIYRENAGLPKNPRKKHHHGISFGVPLLDFVSFYFSKS